jgi:hypothetical protein
MHATSIAYSLDSDHGLVNEGDLFDAPPVLPVLDRQRVEVGGIAVTKVVGEFWTSRQRQASSIHEVSYRACFKPQLPAYFIKRFTQEGDIVYDPFSGRGTTVIEAALWGRRIIANDVNPLSTTLAKARLDVPSVEEVERRLRSITVSKGLKADIDLSMFYHPDTESELLSLREYLREKRDEGCEDRADAWIRMVATNRLTGHSSGFFSVYTFPPNQAVSQQSQIRINDRRKQVPEYRDVKAIILKKTRQLLKGVSSGDIENLHKASSSSVFLTGDAGATPQIPCDSVQLTVTSPPFLDVVQYADDNWLRCWFNCLPIDDIAAGITMARTVESWAQVMSRVFEELYRITCKGGVVAFEVGEVRKGAIKLDEIVVPLGVKAGFVCEAILINDQKFTKTANIWGVSNNEAGTNSNRIVLFGKMP